MHAVRRSRTGWSLLVPVLAVLTTVPFLGPGVARADDGRAEVSTGDTVTGELVQAYVEHLDPATAHEHADEAPLTWVETPDGDAVRIPTESIEDVARAEVGATVEVTVGDEVVDEAVGDGAEPAREVLGATVVQAAAEAPELPVAAAGTPTNKVTVVMAVPAGGASDGRSTASVVDMVNGPVATFWSGQSDGAVRLGVDVAVDSRSRPLAAACGDYRGVWKEAAARAGWTPGPGKHLLVHLPAGAPGCADGLAEIGSSLGSGGRLYIRDAVPSVAMHELGHNFGLGHASGQQCDGAVETGTCQVAPYSDWYDVMGYSWSSVGTLNAAHAALLGLLPAAERVDLGSTSPSRTTTLVPMAQASGTRALRLTDSRGTVYWVEYRQASGQDSWLASSPMDLQSGVTVRRAAGQPNTSLLLDGTPSAASGWKSDRRTVLPDGSSTSLAGGEFTVTVQGVTAAGATVRVAGVGALFEQRYAAAGGVDGDLGAPAGGLVCGLRGGGCFQQFHHGSIYWSAATGARVVLTEPIRGRWAALGWENGRLGYPVGDTRCGLTGGGCYQQFQGGALYSTAATGTRMVTGSIRTRWAAQGWETGALGYPTSDEVCGLRDAGCFQTFQGGSVYWSRATGARVATGALRTKWGQLGWETGLLGYPRTDVRCGLAGGGCYQVFQGGSLYSSPTTGVRMVGGVIRDRWAVQGWESGPLGYPVDDARCGLRGGGCFQAYQRGAIYWSPVTGVQVVSGAVRDRWASLGWEAGALGYPLTDTLCGLAGGGCFQLFQGGSLYGSPATGVRTVKGAIRDRWASLGWEAGALGYPVGDEVCGAGGCQQAFQRGRVLWSPATGAYVR